MSANEVGGEVAAAVHVTAYDNSTGIAVTQACFPNCRFPCVPYCPTDGHRTSYIRGDAGLLSDLTTPPASTPGASA